MRTRGVRHVALAAAAATAIAAGAGCSSSKPSSKGTTSSNASTSTVSTLPPITTTTLPLAQEKPLVQAYFKQPGGPGVPLIRFEKGVLPLLDGHVHDPLQCQAQLKALEKRVPSGKVLNQLAGHIPAPALRATVIYVFNAQSLLFATCWANHPADAATVAFAHKQANRFKPSLAYYDVAF